jgi:hypothetical protein
LNVFVFLLLVLGFDFQSKESPFPPLSSRQLLARHDRPVLDEDVLSPLFRRDLLIDAEELVGERSSSQILLGNVSIGIALRLLVLRDIAETSVQPVVPVRLEESAPTETKPEVVGLDVLRRLLRPNEVKQRGVESLGGELHKLASKLSCGFPALAMRLGKMAADEAAAAISVKSRAANDGVGRMIKARSLIVAAREGLFDPSFGLVFERSTVGTVIHDVKAEVDKLQLIRKWHSAMEQIQMMERESLDLVPAEFIDVELDKVSASSPNPLNQCMRVELELSAVFHGVVVDPVDQFRFLNDSSQTIVVGVANIRRCF